ncbi:SDR family NAD(P)-dependent oxidoreductase [Pararhizobium arenae]|uniref:SDR family NAD(P)-dependent oxidoreductase n=1 Tax=Pararhizobium arenae TaxID=1856850 RepID=UPI00094AAB2F|nr:SDR family oxidoreductase [Pararhizobium arenae]
MSGDILPGSLNGHTALVTGGTSGIGRGTVEALSAAGARVFVGSRSFAKAEELSRELTDRGMAVDALEIDVLDERSVSTAFSEIDRTNAALSLLVNNVGTTAYEPFGDIKVSTWDMVMSTNVRSAFLCSQRAIERMLPAGQGQIVNVGSIWATRGGPGRAAYISSKHALVGLTKALDQEFGQHGIRVNMVNPGPVATERAMKTDVDTTGWLEPRDIGNLVAFLASPSSKAVRGAIVDAFGNGKVLGNFD